ncbi:transglycosylase domain-containing protein [Hutsoniella sourekii]
MITGSRVERQKYQKNNQPRQLLKWLLTIIISLFFLGVIGGAAVFGYFAAKSPELTTLDLQSQVTSKIYDQSGELIKELGNQRSEPMEEGEIPDNLRNAVLAIEDARFYDHNGVDPIRILGALIANLRAGQIAQGGSTITQQLVKLSVFSTDFQDQTLERKSQEAWLALQLEQELDKDQILTYYLNKLFYSNNVYGAKAAAETFFGKDIQDITIAEAALLAGIPQAPSQYDPYAYPGEAQARRDLVLDVMLERQLITESEHREAVQIPVEEMLVPLTESTITETDLVIDAYLDVVAKEVQEKLNINIYTDGVEVFTNMDFQAQKKLFDLVNNSQQIEFPNNQMQVASSVIDVTSGDLVAVIGGRKQEISMGLNRAATLNRSVGSTIKPLSAYGPAIEYLDKSTGSLVIDEAYEYSDGSEIYNYDFEYLGNQTYREALSGSRNIPALKVLQEVGLDNAYAFLQKMDITILNDNQRELVESNAIGGEMTPIQLSAAYATLSNYGHYRQPRAVDKVITASGTEEIFDQVERQAMKDSTAYMLTDILKEVPGNFASKAEIDGLYQAGKTGTTNYTKEQLAAHGLGEGDYAAPDGWYAGYTPAYAMATWVGYDNPMEAGNYLSLEETRLPQEIYREMMVYLMRDLPNRDWTKPDSVRQVEIQKYTDPIKLTSPQTPAKLISQELFIKGTEPKERANGSETSDKFTAQFDPASQSILATWAQDNRDDKYELSLNGTIIYSGTGNYIQIPVNSSGSYALQLRVIRDGRTREMRNVTLAVDLSYRIPTNPTVPESESIEETSSVDESQTSVDSSAGGENLSPSPPATQTGDSTPATETTPEGFDPNRQALNGDTLTPPPGE